MIGITLSSRHIAQGQRAAAKAASTVKNNGSAFSTLSHNLSSMLNSRGGIWAQLVKAFYILVSHGGGMYQRDFVGNHSLLDLKKSFLNERATQRKKNNWENRKLLFMIRGCKQTFNEVGLFILILRSLYHHDCCVFFGNYIIITNQNLP